MTELGNRLKEARLSNGMSLEDLQSVTKIQKRYLIGIEEGDFSAMPGNFYVRAFIKQYAEAVHLNPEEIFEMYNSEIPASYHEEIPQKLSRVNTRKTLTERNPKVFDVLPKIVITVFVIGAAALVYYFLQQNAQHHSNQSINNANVPAKISKSKDIGKVKASDNGKKKTDTSSNSDSSTNTGQTQVPPQQVSLISSSGSRSTYELKNTDKFVIKLVSNGQSWVNVKNGQGHSLYNGMLKKDGENSQTVDLTNETSAVLVIGKTPDTDIYINDQKLNYALPPTKMITQRITIQFSPTKK